MSEQSDPQFDAAFAFPEVTALRTALARRDWAACRALLDAVDPNFRTSLIDIGATEKDLTGFLRDVLARDPGDSAAAAMLGRNLIDAAWEVRTDARAKYVSEAQFAGFRDLLGQAEQVLIEAAARSPRDPAVWASRVTTGMGLSVGRSEIRRRYDRLAAIDPHHLRGQTAMVQAMAPKWSGSWEILHAFCRDAMLAAPPGAHQGLLVAEGHTEHWLDLAQDSKDQGRSYLVGDAVRAEIYEAAHRSVWHPDFRRTWGWVGAVNAFAFVFSLMDDRPAAASMFTALGPLGAEFPWLYLGDAAENFRRLRAHALAGSGAVR